MKDISHGGVACCSSPGGAADVAAAEALPGLAPCTESPRSENTSPPAPEGLLIARAAR